MTEQAIQVLLVEDDEEDYMLTCEYLNEKDGNRFETTWARSLQAAMETLSKQSVDAVLFDLSLPDSGGLEGLIQLRRNYPSLPVVILTGLTDEEVGAKAVQEGAQDYLVKQDLQGSMLQRTLRYAIERKKTSDQLQEYADKLQQQNNEITENLRLARKVQQRLLPQEKRVFPLSAPIEQKTLCFDHIYRPSTIMSGDFFDILQISDTKAGAFICDVMGHGIRAALITAVVRGLVEELRHYADQPGRFLTEMNRLLVSILRSPGELIFVSALYVVVDAETGDTRYTIAGHPPPLHGSRVNGTVDFVNTDKRKQGPALGLYEDETYDIHQCRLAADDVLVCFTDGVYEVLCKSGEEFGSQRVRESVQYHLNEPLDTLLQQLVADAAAFSGAGEDGVDDDICLLGLTFRNHNQQTDKRTRQ